MEDSGEPRLDAVPCPGCAEPSKSLLELCAECQLEATAEAKALAKRVADKYPIIKPFTDMGKGLE